jgi:hypothetical protein
MKTKFIFVDVEALGKSPVNGTMTEFGCVDFETEETFHGLLVEAVPDPVNPAVPFIEPDACVYDHEAVWMALTGWLGKLGPGRNVLMSDNPAYDFMWMAGFFDRLNQENPFGHSGRRISDIYAGLSGNWRDTQGWKKWRVTPHDHNPVNDAMGNVEAFKFMLKKYGQKGLTT